MAKDKAKQEEEVDPYAGVMSTGLRDDFDGLIESIEFTYDSDYNDGKSMIARVEVKDLDFAGRDSDFKEKFGEREILKLSTGSGLVPADKGRTCEREDGKKLKGFQRNCNYQIFVIATVGVAMEELEKRGRPFPWDAGWAEGMVLHFNREEYEPFNHDPKKQLPSRLLPTKFIGTEGTSGAASGGGKKKKKDKAKSE